MAADKPRKLVVVTGGAGYIGSTLCRLLLRYGYRVRAVDTLYYGGQSLLGLLNDPDFELVREDIRDRKAMGGWLRGASAVIHLAALVGDKICDQNREAATAINLTATRDVVLQCRRLGIGRFVFASTSSNYGVMDTSRAADEEFPLNPVSLYAETKVECERFLLEQAPRQFHPVIFRFASGFGVSGRIRFDLTVNSFSYEAWRDKKIVVFAANTWRPYIHVYDMARVLMLGLTAPASAVGGRVFNAGADTMNYIKSDISRMIAECLPGLEVTTIEKQDNRTYRLDFGRIRKELGWQPTRSVTDGIRELLQSFEAGTVNQEYFLDNSLERIKTIS